MTMSSVRRGKASRACASSDSEKRRWVQPEEKVLVVIWSPVRPWKTYLLYTLLGRLRGIQRERTIRFRVAGRPKVACALIDDQRRRLCVRIIITSGRMPRGEEEAFDRVP